jgi:hypothetical protein
VLGMLRETCVCVPPLVLPKEAHLDLLGAPAINQIISARIVVVLTRSSRSARRDLYAVE